jgi:hypothetical protein
MLMLIILICFPFLIWQAYKKQRLSRMSSAWPTVPGTVTGADRIKLAWRTQPRVTYAYVVEGKAYSSSKVTFADAVPASETEPILARYPLHQPVTVHYQPADPAIAVLEAGPNRHVSVAFRYYLVWYAFIVLLNIANIGFGVWQYAHDSDEPLPRTYGDSPAPAADADPQLGNKLLRDDAEKGNAQDQVYVATWFLSGTQGYPKDPAQAAVWLQKSADQGNAQAEAMLANLYAKGNGVAQDLPQALSLLQKAADQGEPHACYGLGVAHEKGLLGLSPDSQKAIDWYRKAGDEPHAKSALARLGAGP